MDRLTKEQAIEKHIAECKHRIEVIDEYMGIPKADIESCYQNIFVFETVISTLKEWQKLKERDTDMKVKRDGDDLSNCPCCGSYNVYYCEEDKRYDFCPNCGQRLKWEE